MEPRLIVHGGAWNIPDEIWPAHQRGCARAHQRGMAVLERGGSSLEAVVAAIRVLEDDPVFDAGYGSHLNEAGQVELDAGLMTGHDLASGAVVGVSRVKNPIELARRVLEQSPHCLFTGEGAHLLAQRTGMVMKDPGSLIHPREREILAKIQNGETRILENAWRQGDTVGAVALDTLGRLAAGNSTGGTLNKAIGRVGDAALIGCGYYADDRQGAVVCTGWGEAIMRSAMAPYALNALGEHDPRTAVVLAIQRLQERLAGFGGLALMAPSGHWGVAYNTRRMAYHTPETGGTAHRI